MLTTLDGVESIFKDLRRQRRTDLDQALIAAAHSDFCAPFVFRRVHYTGCRGLVNVGTWVRVPVAPEYNRADGYLLPPVASSWLAKDATVPYILIIERVRDAAQAPFNASVDADGSPIKIFVTVLSLDNETDSEKGSSEVYKQDNLLLYIERSFFAKEDEGCCNLGRVRAVLSDWLTWPSVGGYIKI